MRLRQPPHSLPLFLLLAQVSSAQSQPSPILPPPPRPSPAINNGSTEYAYLGCYEETIALANTSHHRALHGGTDQVGEGRMTVPVCLAFCGGDRDGEKQYEYAGLEYSR